MSSKNKSSWNLNNKNLKCLRKTINWSHFWRLLKKQILSQQRLLNDITDNHVNLRHLVADLQSSTEEKLLMANYKEIWIQVAKLELNHIRNERDSLKLQYENTEQDLITRTKEIDDLKKGFQYERQNYNIKLKFLQKSLCCLKAKYAKFTPLVFLTNFVYAYNSFLKKKSSLTSLDDFSKPDILNGYIEEVIKAALKEYNFEMEENQRVIKLIKTETQCKLFEDQIKHWEKRCSELEQDLNATRLKIASESEHWHTIEALFGADEKSLKSQDQTDADNAQLTKEIGCNNDNIPIPAERNLSASKSRKVSIELVDKNESPIPSPIKNRNKEISTQTENKEPEMASILEEVPSAGNENNKPALEDNEDISKASVEVEIQTDSKTLNRDTKSVQTLDLEDIKSSDNGKECKEAELKQALAKLQTMEDSLSQAKLEIQKLEKDLQETKEYKIPEKVDKSCAAVEQTQATSLQSDVIEKTILSFHTLLSGKRQVHRKISDILQNEREQNYLNLNKLTTEIESLKSTVVNLNFNIKTKDMEILELKTQLEAQTKRRNSNEKLDLAKELTTGCEETVDNSLHEMTDEKIEEMFEENPIPAI
ncbi:hypothetical protein DOY81_013256, partial [Sarcophaga bullata]